jgi:hypothetical protein
MPIKNNGYTQVKAHASQDKKRKEADLRQGKYDALTVTEKIALATSRGGSKRELARLRGEYVRKAELPPAPVAVAPVVNTDKPAKKRQSKKQVIEVAKQARPSKS